MTPAELPAVRNLVYKTSLCAPDGHLWTKVHAGAIDLLVVCTKCGRTPLEMLEQMPLENRG